MKLLTISPTVCDQESDTQKLSDEQLSLVTGAYGAQDRPAWGRGYDRDRYDRDRYEDRDDRWRFSRRERYWHQRGWW